MLNKLLGQDEPSTVTSDRACLLLKHWPHGIALASNTRTKVLFGSTIFNVGLRATIILVVKNNGVQSVYK